MYTGLQHLSISWNQPYLALLSLIIFRDCFLMLIEASWQAGLFTRKIRKIAMDALNIFCPTSNCWLVWFFIFVSPLGFSLLIQWTEAMADPVAWKKNFFTGFGTSLDAIIAIIVILRWIQFELKMTVSRSKFRSHLHWCMRLDLFWFYLEFLGRIWDYR